jgi:hypothetical protein
VPAIGKPEVTLDRLPAPGTSAPGASNVIMRVLRVDHWTHVQCA